MKPRPPTAVDACRVARSGQRIAQWLLAAILVTPAAAGAQVLPATPLTLFDGRLVVTGSVAVSAGTADDRSYYNLAGYDIDLLRAAQAQVSASWRLSSRVAVVADVYGVTPSDRWHLEAYPTSLYLQWQPMRSRRLTLRGGIVPPAFGGFLQRRYGVDNPLIGYPLTAHYATTIRPDAVPATADELLRKRAFGSVVRYSVGATNRDAGLPLVNAFGWNPGVGVGFEAGRLRGEVTLTRGGIANHWTDKHHGSWEGSGRVQASFGPGLVVGASLAYGSFLDSSLDTIVAAARANRHPRETAVGLDAEYSVGYWIVRAEITASRHTLPALGAPLLDGALWATGVDGEVRYKLAPGFYLAARASHLAFSRVDGSRGSDTWDANVGRVELGAGYSITRNVLLKVSHQYQTRDATWFPSRHSTAGQVSLWF